MACYPGDNPIDKDDPKGLNRAAIWKWAIKPYGVDPRTGLETGGGISEGRSFHDVGESINRHFYGGAATNRPEWITDVLSGRKTPLKPFALDLWKKSYNRRMIVEQAKRQTDAILKEQKQAPLFRGIGKVLEFPRKIAVWEHGIPLGITHPGDLAFQPRNMGTYFSKLFTIFGHAYPFAGAKAGARLDASVEQMLDTMKRNSLYDLALYSKLAVGEKSTVGNLGPEKASSAAARAWSIIKTMRFEMWENEMQKVLKPGMSEEDKLAYGKELAEMYNHATGSGEGWLHPNIKGAFFGPKLTESKWNRLISDPLKTINTFANWQKSTPAERYVAFRRLSRATQYLGVLGGALGVNWGLNKATGTKDEDNVNFSNPTRADYLSFKMGGLEWSVPGLHTEIKFLANILAISAQATWSLKDINKASHGFGQEGELGKAVGQYLLNKITPGGQVIGELAFGHDWQGRPLPFPWVNQKGDVHHPAMSWGEYAASHLPIPLTGPIKFVYDQLRAKGASALDSVAITRGLIMAGMGFTGLHATPDYVAAKAAAAKRARIAQHLQSR
jgi:hypothetical protein